MDDKKLTKEELKNFFLNMKKEGLDVGIKLKMPSQKEPEIIMNYNSSIDVKLEYYLNTYDDNLVHKNNSEIQIIDMIGTLIPF
jgi:hypothetical protein